ncbi:MxaK protein [Methylocystis suflitae]|uniref:MxaK protein n=1 Tax=Methylocystis suflitae TaxID=2951405 RepID=UPI00210A8FF2|nr:MxaK protein [Methylocystis suflitae]MCQ4191575.1 MxaK protein [Methylocystis suflitae]
MTAFATRIAILRNKTRALWRETKSSFLIAIFLALILTTAALLAEWRGAVDANDAIEALREGRDVAVEANGWPETILARVAFLAARSEIDRARALVEALDRSASIEARARGHYLLANALLRKAFDHIERSELEAANPFVNLAKREYRRALQLAPDYWDAKFNLDVAARIVRDFPDFERNSGDELSADPKKLWTDIPGKPKGLP